MKLRLVPQLSQKLIMTPQLQQAIKLLQLSRLELQQSLTQHLLENPLLDEMQSDAEEGESSATEEKIEDSAALEGQNQSDAAVETREEQGSPEEFSASGWEEYFGRDQRAVRPNIPRRKMSFLRTSKRWQKPRLSRSISSGNCPCPGSVIEKKNLVG